MFEDYPDILTVEEACEALRVGQNAMYQLLNSNKLKAYKMVVLGVSLAPHLRSTS